MTDRLTTLVLGGARSGKSTHAEAIISALPPPWVYVATAQIVDAEMEERIAIHRARRSSDWQTVDAPIDLSAALSSLPGERPVLIDCLTVWLSNLVLGEHDVSMATSALEGALRERGGPTVLVSSEVGLSIVPDNALGRRFRDAQGELNQRMAKIADRVVLVAAGLPLILKPQ